MSFDVIGHIGNDVRMVRKTDGRIVGEAWDEKEGKWLFLESIAAAHDGSAAQAAACHAFRRRQLEKLA